MGSATLTIAWPARTATATKLIPIASNSIVVSFLSGTTVVSPADRHPPHDRQHLDHHILPLPAGTLTLTATAYPTTDGTGIAQATATIGGVVITAGQTANTQHRDGLDNHEFDTDPCKSHDNSRHGDNDLDRNCD